MPPPVAISSSKDSKAADARLARSNTPWKKSNLTLLHVQITQYMTPKGGISGFQESPMLQCRLPKIQPVKGTKWKHQRSFKCRFLLRFFVLGNLSTLFLVNSKGSLYKPKTSKVHILKEKFQNFETFARIREKLRTLYSKSVIRGIFTVNRTTQFAVSPRDPTLRSRRFGITNSLAGVITTLPQTFTEGSKLAQ